MLDDTQRREKARQELWRILDEEATHDALAKHFTRDSDFGSDSLVRLRKSLRRVVRILDGRTTE